MKLLNKFSNYRARRLQYEFLPAAEEIVETPPSPFGRIVLWMVIALLAVALLWSYFGKIDVVAVAQGKIVPEGNVKVIQPASQGVIKSIKVQEGDHVKKGQLLVELDSTLASADVVSLEKSLATAKLERDILNKTLAGQDATALINAANIPDETKEDLRQLMSARRSSVYVKREFLTVAITQAKDQLNSEKQNLATFESNQNTAQAEQQRLRVLQAEAAVSQADANLKNYDTENSMTSATSVVDQDKRIAEIQDNLARAKNSVQLQTITSPVDGTILSLSSNTIGGVVTTAQPFITIVPTGTPVLVEATLANKDAGFVHVGQKAAVKVEAYSFQRYGYLTGTVKSISADAVEDKTRGFVYKMIITLDNKVTSKNNNIQVSPGMAVTPEVTTGQRRIVEFFLDPLMTHIDESLKVR